MSWVACASVTALLCVLCMCQIMSFILSARADSIAINITLNSFDTFYNQPSHRASSRKSLYPSFGTLYPAGTEALVRPRCACHTRVAWCSVSVLVAVCARCGAVAGRERRGHHARPVGLPAVPCHLGTCRGRRGTALFIPFSFSSSLFYLLLCAKRCVV